MVRRMSKNTHFKDMCSKEVELHVQNLLSILSLIINTFWGRRWQMLSSQDSLSVYFDNSQLFKTMLNSSIGVCQIMLL